MMMGNQSSLISRFGFSVFGLSLLIGLPAYAADQTTPAPDQACAASSLSAGQIPFDYASQRAPLIVVQARIGEGLEKANVVVDTGAAPPFAVFVSDAVAKRLALMRSKEITPTETISVGPQRQSYSTATLPRFELGPVVLGPTEIAITSMIDQVSTGVGRRVDAIIGYHFLRDRTFSIDYDGRCIDLAARPGPEADAIDFVLAAKKPIVLVKATVNGAGPFTMEIDTGATGTVLSPSAAVRAQVTAQGQGVQGGAGGSVQVGVSSAVFAFGGVSRTLERVAISEAMTTISAGAGTPIDGILATDFFQGKRLTVDYSSRRLWLGHGK
jgi:predicted aspartyl protease